MAPDSFPLDGLLDGLPDGIVIADANGFVVRANDMAARLLGRSDLIGVRLENALRLQDLEGRDWMGVNAPYSGLRIRRLMAEQAWFLEDGTELLVTARINRSSPRAPVDSVAVSFRSARARSRLDRDRSDLIATIAHELRSPLTGVRGFAQGVLARWDKITDDQKKLIMQSVHTDTDRLTRLIAELLEVARIDTGRLSLFPRPIDLVAATEQVTRSVEAGSGREVTFSPSGAVSMIQADPDRLAQVITNLVENAIRHGEGRVDVTCGAAGRRGFVSLVVEDEGEGISEDIRSRVFTKFWRHGTRGGTGLGLYIVHGLVVAHGGHISIADSAGGGARIEVLWPVAAGSSE